MTKGRPAHRNVVAWSVRINDGDPIRSVGIVDGASEAETIRRLLNSPGQHLRQARSEANLTDLVEISWGVHYDPRP